MKGAVLRRARGVALAAGLGLLFAHTATAETEQSTPQAEPPEPAATEGASLEERVRELEAARRDAETAARERDRLEERVEELERALGTAGAAGPQTQKLEQRVEELEASKVAHEDATRAIIQQTFQTLGSKINEFVSLGGVIEVLTRSQEDFFGTDEETIDLDVAELQLEVQVTDWARANLVLEYDDGGGVEFRDEKDDSFAIDRINIDTAEVYIGNTERFWPYARAGRAILPFGISTGDPVADVLTLTDPLTVEAFETRADAIQIGIEFPTPPLVPETLTPAPPRVQPLVINPLVRNLAYLIGYRPLPAPPPPPAYLTPTPAQAPFNAGVYFFRGDTFRKGKPNRQGEWDPLKHLGATVGYRTRGTCRSHQGDPEAIGISGWLRRLCPWALDTDVDYIRSVYDSRFLSSEYRSSGIPFIVPDRSSLDFLEQIGIVSGLAAHLKLNLGPFGIVAEWNGALTEESFFDDRIALADFGGVETPIRMQPSAWQISLSYQFDWNPSVESIGAQGTYLAIGYSESRDLAGVARFNDQTQEAQRFGAVPKRRLLVNAGEWVHENVRIAFEYSYELDYRGNQAGVRFSPTAGLQDSTRTGGTGNTAHGFSALLTFDW
jgi:hypothetical protein